MTKPDNVSMSVTSNDVLAKLGPDFAVEQLEMLTRLLARWINPFTHFVNMEINDDSEGTLILTVQRLHGKSPARAIEELKQRVAELEKENQRMLEVISSIPIP